MQKIALLTIPVLIFSLTAQAQNDRRDNNRQNSTPPPAVQKTFQKEHPNTNTSDANWQQSSNHQWHVSQTAQNGRQSDAYYNQNGKQIDSHRPIERNEVPATVDKHIRGRYHAEDYTATRIDRPGLSAIFQVSILQGNRHRQIYTDNRGREVKYNDHH